MYYKSLYSETLNDIGYKEKIIIPCLEQITINAQNGSEYRTTFWYLVEHYQVANQEPMASIKESPLKSLIIMLMYIIHKNIISHDFVSKDVYSNQRIVK